LSKQFTLGKNERLKSRKLIEQLFSEGQRFAVFPFRVFYLFTKKNTAITRNQLQCGAGVSSKNFKKAVDRNRIKRLTREAYRLQKKDLLARVNDNKLELVLFFIYTGKELPGFAIVKEKVAVILNKLIMIVDETTIANT
jgi:ribonuclease P protein component